MSIDISRPWARMQTADSGEAAGFVTLTNRGPEPDRLAGAASTVAEKTEIWGIKVVGPVLRMQPLEDGLRLPIAMAIELKPRGYHLFLQGLKRPLVRGEKVPVTLHFAKAGTRQVELVVKAEGLINKDTLGFHESKPVSPSDGMRKPTQAG